MTNSNDPRATRITTGAPTRIRNPHQNDDKRKKAWLLAAIIGLLLAGAAAVVYFFVIDNDDSHSKRHRSELYDDEDDDYDDDEEDDDEVLLTAPTTEEEEEVVEEMLPVEPLSSDPAPQQEKVKQNNRYTEIMVDDDEDDEILPATRSEADASLRQAEIVKEQRREDANENMIFEVVEQQPEFPDGNVMSYIATHVVYPPEAEENGIHGRVVCTFVVEKDGSIGNVKVVKSVDPSLDKEAVRVISGMPKWRPGKQEGQPVRVKYTLPITFRLE